MRLEWEKAGKIPHMVPKMHSGFNKCDYPCSFPSFAKSEITTPVLEVFERATQNVG